MEIINLNKFIKDFEEIFDTALDDRGIASLFDLVDRRSCSIGVLEGDAFCVEQKKYYKNGFGSLDSETISFNFEMTERLCTYIIDEDTGEQCLDEVEKEVFTYLGYN